MKKFISIYFLLTLALQSCKDDVEQINPNISQDTTGNSIALTADFSYKILINESGPDTFQFKNNSKNATSLKWYFGNLDSSSLENPTIVFPEDKIYTVKLFTYNGSKQKFLVRNITVKDLIAEDTIKNPNSIKPNANFKIYFNIDSNYVLHTFNISSSNAVKAKWYVNDVFASDLIQPSLQVNGSQSSVKITLIVEEFYGRKDTLSKYIPLKDYMIDFGSSHFLLKSINPVTYTFHHTNYNNRYGITTISFSDHYTINRVPFVEGYQKTFDNSDAQNVIFSLDLPDYTVYKRVKTFNISEYLPVLNALQGQYLFEERYTQEQINSNNIRTDFNDTVLSLVQTNVTKFSISDLTLQHNFEGYLSSYTNSTTIDLRVPSVNYPQIGSYFHSYIKIPRNSDNIQMEKYSSTGSKTGGSYKLNYNGRKI